MTLVEIAALFEGDSGAQLAVVDTAGNLSIVTCGAYHVATGKPLSIVFAGKYGQLPLWYYPERDILGPGLADVQLTLLYPAREWGNLS